MKLRRLILLTAGLTAGCALMAQTGAGKRQAKETDPTANNPTYSVAVRDGHDPQEYLKDAESKFQSAPSPRSGLWNLTDAAKLALEANELQKAYDYATKALAIAEDWDRVSRSPDPATDRVVRGFRTGHTIFYANMVLGRLAILKGDIRSAEQYLLASGKTPGDAVLCSYGPNLSLARELLKHGDKQSRDVVLQFLDDISVFWNMQPSPIPKWSAEIRSGGMPDFQSAGDNLFY